VLDRHRQSGDDGVPGPAVSAVVALLSTLVNQQSREIPARSF
jgi:hypothetical protein